MAAKKKCVEYTAFYLSYTVTITKQSWAMWLGRTASENATKPYCQHSYVRHVLNDIGANLRRAWGVLLQLLAACNFYATYMRNREFILNPSTYVCLNVRVVAKVRWANINTYASVTLRTSCDTYTYSRPAMRWIRMAGRVGAPARVCCLRRGPGRIVLHVVPGT